MKAILRRLPIALLAVLFGCHEVPTENAGSSTEALFGKGGNKPPKDPPGGGGSADPAIAFVDDGTLHVMNADGSMKTALVDGVSRGVSWSPDATRIAYGPGGTGYHETIVVAELSLIDGIPTVTAQLDLELPHPSAPVWSPLGDLIAYGGSCDPGEPDGTCGDWGHGNHLRAVPAAGGEAFTMYEAPGCADPWACLIDGRPTWSPDGSRIAFVEARGPYLSTKSLRAVDVADTPTQVSQALIEPGEIATICNPDWSPDGSKIAFWGHETSASPTNLFVFDLATGARTNLGLEARRHCADVSWSPDGTKWVVDTGDAIRIVDADATSPQYGQVIPRSKSKLSWGYSPDWRPCEAGPGCGLTP